MFLYIVATAIKTVGYIRANTLADLTAEAVSAPVFIYPIICSKACFCSWIMENSIMLLPIYL